MYHTAYCLSKLLICWPIPIKFSSGVEFSQLWNCFNFYEKRWWGRKDKLKLVDLLERVTENQTSSILLHVEQFDLWWNESVKRARIRSRDASVYSEYSFNVFFQSTCS